MNSGLHWALISAWSLSSLCEKKCHPTEHAWGILMRGLVLMMQCLFIQKFLLFSCMLALSFYHTPIWLFSLNHCWVMWCLLLRKAADALSHFRNPWLFLRAGRWDSANWKAQRWNNGTENKRAPCAFAISPIQLPLLRKEKNTSFIPMLWPCAFLLHIYPPFSLALPLYVSVSFSSAQPLCHSHRQARERLLGNVWKPKSLGSLFPLPRPASTPTLWLTFISSQGKCISPRANTMQRPFKCSL